jgi:hydrogenase/urease accessory protein HupE
MRASRIISVLICLAFTLGLAPSFADELRPAYIEITERSVGTWSLLWKVSENSKLGRIGTVLLPKNCKLNGSFQTKRSNTNLIRTALLSCNGPIAGQTIGLLGLETSSTDALVRIKSLSDATITLRLTPRESRVVVPVLEQGASGNVVVTYFGLGVEHILFGFDHFLFVLCLVLLLTGWKRIAWTITAFTIAHSMSLIGTTMGLFALPQKPVEAIIALSIVFLAAEIIKAKPNQLRLSERNPEAVAFLFGLLHGFGFAGALAEIGLPPTDVPLALLSFNLGVEIGQLLIISTALFSLAVVKNVWREGVSRVKCISAYLIGSLAMYWLIDRLLSSMSWF